MVLVAGSLNTRATFAGASASLANRSGSGDQGTMSMRSPASARFDDRLHARALETHAGADRIDRVVAREDGDFRAAAHLARRGANLDDVLLDLRDLELEQRLNEERVATAENEARPFGVSSTRLSTARMGSP